MEYKDKDWEKQNIRTGKAGKENCIREKSALGRYESPPVIHAHENDWHAKLDGPRDDPSAIVSAKSISKGG